jgi:hypothetical protein
VASQVLEDDAVTQEEQNRLFAFTGALGLSLDNLGARHRDMLEDIVIAGINDGRLPEVPAEQAHVMTRPSETIHGEWPAALMKEVAVREWRGGTAGVSVPLAKGVRYRVGAIRGRSVVVGQELVAEDQGMFAVTSRRSMFVGSKKTLEFQHKARGA